MTQGAPSPIDAVRSLATDYCLAIHNSTPDVFTRMLHDNFHMTGVRSSGTAQFWDKAAYLERVASRSPAEGEPSYEILGVDVAGHEIARVHLWVDVPPRRLEDHLGFVCVGGTWKLMTKVFRTLDGPELEG